MRDVAANTDRVQPGEARAAEELLPLVYTELRRLAAHKIANEVPGHTLQPTALVHEAWLRLVGDGGQNWNSRGHFISAAAEAMRRILIESARRKKAKCRGEHPKREELKEEHWILERPADEVLAVHEALDRLAAEDGVAAELVKLRYFIGMSLPEAAEALGMSPRTADRLWAFARTWLKVDLETEQ
ncbi:MAG: ECF-type sigma factor [Verrucomicrobiales bacterium]|nr:ECF-type sigma factor [Verrucomicrobiales bacterium]